MAALGVFPPQKAFGSITDGPAAIIRSYCHPMMCPVSRGDYLAQSEVLRTLHAPKLRTYSAGTFLGRLVRELRSQEAIRNDALLVKAVWTKAVQLIRKGCHIIGREDLQSMGISPSITTEPVSYDQMNAIGNRIVWKEEEILGRLSERFFGGHPVALECQFSPQFLRDVLGDIPDHAARGATVRGWMARQPHRNIDYKLTIEEGAVQGYFVSLRGSSDVKSFCVGSALVYAVKDGNIQAVRLILENAVHLDPLLMAAALLVAVVQGYNPILMLILKRPQQEFANFLVRDAWKLAQKLKNTEAQNFLAAHFSAKTFYAPMESLPLNAPHYRK